MSDSNDSTGEDKLKNLIEQVDRDHGSEGAGSMADHLRDRMAETHVEPEAPTDGQG
jgi:hypothetical protein